jgi:hypothetical protein
MRSKENVEEAIRKKLRFRADSTLRDRWRKEVLQAQGGFTESSPALREPALRRRIMRHPMIKLAAAAAIVMTVILGFNLVGGPDTAHVAWGRVLETMETVPTVVFHMTRTTTFGENNTRTDGSTVYDAGPRGSRIDTFIDGKLFHQKFLLLDQKLFYAIRPQEKVYYRMTLPENYGAEAEGDTPQHWVKTILSEDYTELGRSTIDGVACEGVEVRNSTLLAGSEGTIRLWVDVASNLPVRIELETMGMESGRKWPMEFVMSDFPWDVAMDEGTFQPQIPDDFTQREEPQARPAGQKPQAQAAPARTLTDQEQAQQTQVKETVAQFFQACQDRNWDQICALHIGLDGLDAERRASVAAQLAAIRVAEIGEPFKTQSSDDIWHVPCRISPKAGMAPDDDEIRVRYDGARGRFVICGGP